MSEIKMVAGLGNPGDGYGDTRHNVGFRVIDSLAEILLKPWKFMNCSGEPIARAVGFYKLEVGDLLVITDDMALSPGRIRIRTKGSSGGHNGLADIIEKLDTFEFGRLRVGIGQSDKEDAVDFVLDEPTETEKRLLDEAIEKAREAVLCWVEYGIETTMNKYN
jgi:PTH1 family peptidyl-tRNA hydrolase